MYSSLARETCQNSMDAKLKGQEYASAEMDVEGLGEYLPDMEDVFDSKATEREEKKQHSILDIKEIVATKERPREQVKEEIDDGQFQEDGGYT